MYTDKSTVYLQHLLKLKQINNYILSVANTKKKLWKKGASTPVWLHLFSIHLASVYFLQYNWFVEVWNLTNPVNVILK